MNEVQADKVLAEMEARLKQRRLRHALAHTKRRPKPTYSFHREEAKVAQQVAELFGWKSELSPP